MDIDLLHLLSDHPGQLNIHFQAPECLLHCLTILEDKDLESVLTLLQPILFVLRERCKNSLLQSYFDYAIDGLYLCI